ncbi:nucleoside deaminase [Rhodovulum sp. DZ06]|uniref:nucleoside deaminase n=1 Tax=Rhodovulum sp. DZ06 TaxID=3425126 RepID=UPI003D332722
MARTPVAAPVIEDAARLEALLRRAVALAARNAAEGGAPFGALVAAPDGTILGEGVNTVRRDHDPLAHAEVEALRDAGRRRRSSDLSGLILVASAEPCVLCRAAARVAGIGEIRYAVDRDAAAARGYDYRDGYALLAPAAEDMRPTCRHHPVPGAEAALGAAPKAASMAASMAADRPIRRGRGG